MNNFDRRNELLTKKFETGLTPEEERELQTLQDVVVNSIESEYWASIQKSLENEPHA